MAISKVVYGGRALMDITDSTVAASNMLEGTIAYGADGNRIVGTMSTGALYAAVSVVYPEGATCTCLNGDKTLVAEDTSGTVVFGIPSAGTWIISASLGDNETSKTIEISSKGYVELHYLLWWDGILYNAGYENEEITGGLDDSYASRAGTAPVAVSFSRRTGYLYVSTSTNNASPCLVTTNKIDLTPWSYANMEIDFTASSGDIMSIGVATSKTAFYEKATVKTDIKAISSGTVTADIRDLTGEYYVGVSGRRVASSTMRFTITKIWLE